MQKSFRKFTPGEAGNRFIGLRRFTLAKNIAKNRGARSAAEERRSQQTRTHRNSLEFSVNQDVARRFGGRENTLLQNPQVATHRRNGTVAAEALRATLDEIPAP